MVQMEAPGPEKRPMGHLIHAVGAVAPKAPLKVPEGHAVQTAVPVKSA